MCCSWWADAVKSCGVMPIFPEAWDETNKKVKS